MVNLMLASQSPHTNDATFKSPSENGSGTSMEEYPSLYTLMPKHSPTSTETSTSTRTITITVEKASSAQESRFSQSPSETFLLSSATSKISPSAKSFSDSEISSSSSTFFSEDSSATFIQFPTEVDSNLSPTTSRPISTLPSDTLLSLGSDTNSTISINHLLLATVASPPPSPSSSPSSSSPPLSTSSMNTDTTTSYWPTLTSRSSSAPGYGMCFDPRLNMNVPCSATGTLPAAPALATTSTTTSAAAAAAGVTNSLIHRFPAAWCICVTVVVALVSLVGLL
ncbi:hypothetical protein L228DRAFT_247167 [Xylona heveae TC161]|uniref:Uncharacterized protein n=1 Tax=Xylona heveae (strain CBS 132557 / TC161) TaxID=1328760 RepID=A0A165GZ42_XYLHT|nr:hypothetical protein L228DRAFT_247167 [Xylona heveae TC161]KZF22782.1 hypothetical protein L228DRAFT_247167 [Xylona heveae TC161]